MTSTLDIWIYPAQNQTTKRSKVLNLLVMYPCLASLLHSIFTLVTYWLLIRISKVVPKAQSHFCPSLKYLLFLCSLFVKKKQIQRSSKLWCHLFPCSISDVRQVSSWKWLFSRSHLFRLLLDVYLSFPPSHSMFYVHHVFSWIWGTDSPFPRTCS